MFKFIVNSFFFSIRVDKMGQYFSNEQLESKIKKYETMILGRRFTFFTDNGVFCKDYLDFGTRLLLEHLPLATLGSTLLDVGCGYGVIGVVLGKLCDLSVDMVDVNHRALHLAKMNAKENQVMHCNIYESNCYQNVDGKYDTIVTNPPIRAGKKIVYEIVFGAKEHLNPNGQLFLVIRKDQGAKSLISDLEKCYTVEVLERNKGFFVIKCTL